MKTNQLFKVIADNSFGTYLATTANKEIVLEFPDGIRAYPSNEIEKVTPYTVRVRAFNAACGKTWTASPDDNLAVNDVLLVTSVTPPEFAIVEAVDTKKEAAPDLTFKKLAFV